MATPSFDELLDSLPDEVKKEVLGNSGGDIVVSNEETPPDDKKKKKLTPIFGETPPLEKFDKGNAAPGGAVVKAADPAALATQQAYRIAMANPSRPNMQPSKIRSSAGNVVAGSMDRGWTLRQSLGLDPAPGRGAWKTPWQDAHNATVQHRTIKGADGTVYHQEVDRSKGTARYYSVNKFGDVTEYKGDRDANLSAREQITRAMQAEKTEAAKQRARDKGVMLEGDTEMTAKGVEAEYNRTFGKDIKALQDDKNLLEATRWRNENGDKDEKGKLGSIVSELEKDVANRQTSLDQRRVDWSNLGEGRQNYGWRDRDAQRTGGTVEAGLAETSQMGPPRPITPEAPTTITGNGMGDQIKPAAKPGQRTGELPLGPTGPKEELVV